MGYTTNFTGNIRIEPAVLSGHQMEFFKRYQPEFGTPKIDNPPSKYCDWEISEEGAWLRHNGAEKSYHQDAWLRRLIRDFFIPRGHVLNGIIHCQGEEPNDSWSLLVEDNVVNGGNFPEELTLQEREEMLRVDADYRPAYLDMSREELAALGDGMAYTPFDRDPRTSQVTEADEEILRYASAAASGIPKNLEGPTVVFDPTEMPPEVVEALGPAIVKDVTENGWPRYRRVSDQEESDLKEVIDAIQPESARRQVLAAIGETAPEPTSPEITVQELGAFLRKMSDGVLEAAGESNEAAMEFVDGILTHMNRAGETGDLTRLKEFLKMDEETGKPPTKHSKWREVRETLLKDPDWAAAYKATEQGAKRLLEAIENGPEEDEEPSDLDAELRRIHERVQAILDADAPDTGEAVDVLLDLTEGMIDVAAAKASELVQVGAAYVRGLLSGKGLWGMDDMTPPEEGEAPKYVIWSTRRMKWWGPNERGYTSDISEAGRYSLDDAQMILRRTTYTWAPEEDGLPSAMVCLAPPLN